MAPTSLTMAGAVVVRMGRLKVMCIDRTRDAAGAESSMAG